MYPTYVYVYLFILQFFTYALILIGGEKKSLNFTLLPYFILQLLSFL